MFLGEKCPRPDCGGNLYLEHSGYYWEKKCLLCSRSISITPEELKEWKRLDARVARTNE